MGRPKKGSKTPKPAAAGPDARAVIAHLKGSLEYAAWLEEVHQKTDIPKTMIIRRALEDWAKKYGHRAPPEI